MWRGGLTRCCWWWWCGYSSQFHLLIAFRLLLPPPRPLIFYNILSVKERRKTCRKCWKEAYARKKKRMHEDRGWKKRVQEGNIARFKSRKSRDSKSREERAKTRVKERGKNTRMSAKRGVRKAYFVWEKKEAYAKGKRKRFFFLFSLIRFFFLS